MNKNTDKRLLASLDYIDDKFTERAASRIKTRSVGVTGGVSKKRMIRYVSLLAACMIILGAAIPIATSLISKLPEIIAPSASQEGTTAQETTPDAELPEEYFSDRYYGGVNNVCKYGDEFIYAVRIQNNASYCNLVKFDPESNEVAYLCAERKCEHTPEDCPLASPEGSGWNMNYIEVFGDWLIYDYSYSGADKVLLGMTVSLYNLKTGESKIASEPTLYKHANSYYVMNGKVYLGIGEWELEENVYTESKRYIVSYDPETGESVYMCDIPDGVSFVGVSNKRFFFAKGMEEIYSCSYTGDNLKKEEFLDFYPVALSGTYAYKFSTKDDDGNPATKSVYDLATNSKFTIDFGGELHFFLLLEDKIIYTVYKSEDRSGGTELWTCDKRGENKKLLFESDEVLPTPDNCIGSYIICSVNKKVNRERCVFNLETGEYMTVPVISNQK